MAKIKILFFKLKLLFINYLKKMYFKYIHEYFIIF